MENSFKDSVKPEDWQLFAKYSGSLAARKMDLDYISGPAASLIAAYKGNSAGVYQRQFVQAVVGSHLSPKAAQQWADAGLVSDPEHNLIKKKGVVVGIKPGGIVDSEKAQTNSYAWVHESFLPRLRKHGFNEEQIDQWVSGAIENSSVRQLVDFYRSNKSRIDKDIGLSNQAMGLGAADVWSEKDAKTSMRKVERQIENFKRSAAEPLMETGTKGLNVVSSFLDWWEEKVAKEHPWADTALSGGATGAGLLGTYYGGSKLAKMFRPTGAKEIAEAVEGIKTPPTPATGPSMTSPNMRAVGAYEAAVRALAENGGKAEALSGAAAETFAKAHPDAQARMIKAAMETIKSSPAGGSLVKAIARGLGKGAAGAAIAMAGEYALNKGEEHFLGWTPESKASTEEQVTEKAHEWWRSHGINAPWWKPPEGRRLPTMADEAKGDSGSTSPQIDDSRMEQGKAKAKEVGQEIKKALEVTAAPSVDNSALEATLALIHKISGALAGLSQTSAVAAARAQSGASHALHDGPENH